MSSDQDTAAPDVPALLGVIGGENLVAVSSAIGVAVENSLSSDANLLVLIFIASLPQCLQFTHRYEFAWDVGFLFQRLPMRRSSHGRGSIRPGASRIMPGA
ncbi:hypothetical protein IG631_23611 [Alternaria alternata]|nr:hypothetical protein IG631_23611 [Alternaria alternata]